MNSDMSQDSRLQKRLRPLARAPSDGLMLHEIYASVQGESSFVGLPCTFVRTTACHLRCNYCDTRQAFANGAPWRLDAIIERIASLGPKLVLITGGEPLLQRNVLPLMTQLCDLGYTVCIETSGALDIAPIDPRVVRIVDIKTPASGEVAANAMGNLDIVRASDEFKFVLSDRDDYVWARDFVAAHHLDKRCTVLFGPVWGRLDPQALVSWILADKLAVRMQVQMHKYIWSAETQGV